MTQLYFVKDVYASKIDKSIDDAVEMVCQHGPKSFRAFSPPLTHADGYTIHAWSWNDEVASHVELIEYGGDLTALGFEEWKDEA